MQQSIFLLRQSEDVKRELGEDVRLKARWPVSWIDGYVNQLKGRCQVRYKVENREGREAETLFKAVRRTGGAPWEVGECPWGQTTGVTLLTLHSGLSIDLGFEEYRN